MHLFIHFIFFTALTLLIWAASWQNQQCGCAPSKDSDQPGHPPSLIRVFAVGCPGWSEFLLCAQWVVKGPSFLHADSEDSDQTGWMPRLIWVFAGRTAILLVLSWGGSFRLSSPVLNSFVDPVNLKESTLAYSFFYLPYNQTVSWKLSQKGSQQLNSLHSLISLSYQNNLW